MPPGPRAVTYSPEQERIVHHRGSDVQVIACAGSGKTETVSIRVASLIAEGVAPASIIAFTFTEAAAAALKTRILRKVEEQVPTMDLDRLSPMYVGTIHAFCLRFLQERAPRYAAFDLFEDHRLIGLLNREFYRLGLEKLGIKNMTEAIETFLSSASVVENEMLTLDTIHAGSFRDPYLAYLDLLDRYHVLTHNQCIARAVAELERPEVFARYHARLRHLIVDEFQDINPAQARLIQLLARPPVEVCVVGDDDQAIYQWRGSSVDYIRSFARDTGAHTEMLGVNRRSAPAIVDLAARFALSIPDRLPKEIQAQRDPVEGAIHFFVRPTARDEAAAVTDAIARVHTNGIEYRRVAILLRSVRTAGRPFLDELEDRHIPYTCVGRTGLFLQPEAETLAMVYAYLAGRDQLFNARSRQMDAVDLDTLLPRLSRLFALDRRTIEAARHHLKSWRDGLPRARDADLVGSFYRLLRLCDVHLWDADKDAGRLGILARFSDVLADFESVTRRARRMAEEGAPMRGGLTGGQKYVDRLIDYISYYAQTHYEDFPGEPDFDLDAVTITTVHQAKGLEWPIVFVPSLTSRRFPSARTGEPQDWLLPRDLFPAARYEGCDADERRLLYVALTRARDHLYISAHERVTSHRTAPSPYFEELGGADLKPTAEPLWTPTSLPTRPHETEDKPTFSFSELAAYLLCPLSYRFRSRLGFQPPAAKELGYGKAVHHILRRLAELPRERRSLPDGSDVTGLFDADFYLPFADSATFAQMRHKAEQLVGRYLTDYADDLSRVFEVERSFELHLPEANVAGRADVILDREGGDVGQLAIVDYKTRPETHHDPILALQLAIYTAAARGEGLAVRAAYLHDLGEAKAAARSEVAIDAATVEDARRQASSLAGGIRQRSFPPKVGSHCRACDVKLICKQASTRRPCSRNGGAMPRGTSRSSNSTTRTKEVKRTDDYRHKDARPNNPEAGLQSFDRKVPKHVRYEYDPHLDPQLVWASKAERTSFEVDTVSLHIHERISTQAILKAVQRQPAQRSLFADPELPLTKAVKFYEHEVGWANRLVLGDSLLVMNSLLHREGMGGKVQMIYMDPPYGVNYGSNFQPRTDRREVHEGKDDSLTREPEQVKAYRDTWTLGVHSYLTYLRDRLVLARDLLAETGNLFIQISDENLHHLRELLDEVMGPTNFCGLIAFKTTSGLRSDFLATSKDYICWYARSRDRAHFRRLFLQKVRGEEGATQFEYLESPNGRELRTTREVGDDLEAMLRDGWQLLAHADASSVGYATTTAFDYEFAGRVFRLKAANLRWKTTKEGMDRLAAAKRLLVIGNTLRYKRYLEDFPVFPLSDGWTDTGISGFGDKKLYVVQTATKVIQRCVLMTTDPGDLVLDPTCGSGTTAYVAEQWGRRWITCDTSRVAVALARQRLTTATFPYYKLTFEKQGVSGGFEYEEVPHITLKSIAQNLPPDPEKLYDRPEELKGIVRVAGPFTVEAINTLDPGEALAHQPIEERARKDDISHRGKGRASVNDHLAEMTDLLRRDGGINVPGKGRVEIEGLGRIASRPGIHAEGSVKLDGKARRLAVAFGPRFGPVTARLVEEAIQATVGSYDALAVAGFSFDPEVTAFLDKSPPAGLRLFRVQIAPDVLVGDLLKTSHKQNLFAVIGEPDFELKKGKDGWVVTLTGVDVYDPNKNEVLPSSRNEVAAWFLDQDYDGRCLCPGQVFLPGEKGKSFEKLQRALKGLVDEEAWETMSGFESRPFQVGEHKCIAVKVIDVRGNEVVGVRKLGR